MLLEFVDCPECEGEGVVMKSLNLKCDRCNGTGKRGVYVEEG
jgi:DnaJ-class molecular chaperone